MNNFYRAYLYSTHWKQFRKLALEYYGPKCSHCGAEPKTLDVHHLTYERLGCELLDDVVILCRDCHYQLHAEKNKHCPHDNMVKCTSECGDNINFFYTCADCYDIYLPRIPSAKELERAEKKIIKWRAWKIKDDIETAIKETKKKAKAANHKSKPNTKRKGKTKHTPEYWAKRRAIK